MAGGVSNAAPTNGETASQDISKCCVYCGAILASSNDRRGHLLNCEQYKKMVGAITAGALGVSEDCEEEETNDDCSVATTVVSNNSGDNNKRSRDATMVVVQPPFCPSKKQCYSNCWRCLVCGESKCCFDNGATIMDECDGQGDEKDPSEEKPQPDIHSTAAMQKVGEEAESIKSCVRGLLQSKGFFSSNKYIGSVSLNRLLKGWLLARFGCQDTVERNWVALRRATKETLRYKRQVCVERLKKIYIGTFCGVLYLSCCQL